MWLSHDKSGGIFMKRILCALIACVMLLTTAACSGDSGSSEPETMTQIYFTYPTREAFIKSVEFQADMLDLTLPEVEVDDSRELMHFYTYNFPGDISLVIKENVVNGTVMNAEIDTPADVTTDNEMLSKLMKIIVSSIESTQDKDGIENIVKAWKAAEADGASCCSPLGVVYSVKTFGEDMLIYFAQL